MQNGTKQTSTLQDRLNTTLTESGFYADLLSIVYILAGALLPTISHNIVKLLKRKPKDSTLDDSIKYLLHNILAQSKADGLMIGFPTTKKNLKKSPTQSITWEFKINKPNILLNSPTALASEFSTNSSKDWVEIESIFGVYFYKTFYLEGLILAYLLVYDTNKISQENLQKIDTKDLEKYLTLLVQTND